MSKYTFKVEHNSYSAGNKSSVELVTDVVGLPELLADFESFLKGAGFSFNGHVEIVEEDND